MGRILIVEFDDKELSEFDEIMRILNRHPSYVSHRLRDESVLSFANLEIYPERRKVYCDHKKINLTAKEYDLLFLLITNRDIVLTYELIYRNRVLKFVIRSSFRSLLRLTASCQSSIPL